MADFSFWYLLEAHVIGEIENNKRRQERKMEYLKGVAEKLKIPFETAILSTQKLKRTYYEATREEVHEALQKPWDPKKALPFEFIGKAPGDKITKEERELAAFFVMREYEVKKFEQESEYWDELCQGRSMGGIWRRGF